jgi:hypothetical protein
LSDACSGYVQVKGVAFDNGVLRIELIREIPEAIKPRRIAINAHRPRTRFLGELPEVRRQTQALELSLLIVASVVRIRRGVALPI